MKICDCFMFFDEEMILDLRLNIMDKYVDKFVITESTYMHSGKPKKLIFNINNYSKFKDKIIYNVVDEQPTNLESEDQNDSKEIKGNKLINRASSNCKVQQYPDGGGDAEGAFLLPRLLRDRGCLVLLRFLRHGDQILSEVHP